MDVGDHYPPEEMELLDELRQYFPTGTPDKEIIGIYIEMYRNPELLRQYMSQLESYYKEMETDYNVYNECLVPVIQQSFDSVWLLLLYCLILHMLSMMKIPKSLLHVASFMFGCLSLWNFYNDLFVYIVIPVSIIIIICKCWIVPGLFLAAFGGIYMLACEYFILSSVDWTKIKGSVMVVSMKLISISFDQESGIINNVPLLEYFGYTFNPGSVIFGPFITYVDYEQFFNNRNMNINWLYNCVKVLCISIFCLGWSSCGTTHYLPRASNYFPFLESNKWWKAYYEAQQFRFSHFFVCYLSEACCLLMGIGTVVTRSKQVRGDKINTTAKKSKVEKKNNENLKEEIQDEELIWRRPVANLSIVEFPRSLVGVVTNWNLPMHYWLKQYIFKSTRKFGVFAAILITYIASAMLHSLNFQLSAVLLSIGIFAYVESVFRHALAVIFNACIEARSCQKGCQHKYKKNNFWVITINLFYALFAMWNLAYLGCLFDSSEEETKGYSMAHALDKWKQYGYMNHMVMFSIMVLQKLFERFRV